MTEQHTETLPGSTGNPDAAAVFDVAQEAERNAQLRAQLLEENAKLQDALDKSRASGLDSQGLSDEDVRRLERPDEFVVTNDDLQARITELRDQLAKVEAAVSEAAQHTSV